ncbi:RDD family protein [Paenibacillus sp. YSY-4.3]
MYDVLWRRYFAWAIDRIIAGMTALLIGFIFISPREFFLSESRDMDGLLMLLTLLVQWIYYTAMESSKYQATLGKMIFGVIVIDDMEERLTWGRANGRYWSKLISSMFFGFGYLMAIFTNYKQGLHDKIANTYVVNKKILLHRKSNPEPVISTGKLAQASKGFNWPD